MAVTKITMVNADRRRALSGEPDLLLINRFVEANPSLSDNEPAFLKRPGLKFWTQVGDGPVRSFFMAPGTFDDDVFAVSYNTLYRISRLNAGSTAVYDGLIGGDQNSPVRMAATGDFGDQPARLFFADGAGLYVYTEDGYARSTFTATAIADGDVVRLDGVYYRFSSGTLDSGTPAGTSGNPWRVLIGASILASYTNLYRAVNASGTAGTDYSTALTAHTTVIASSATAQGVIIRAVVAGIAGNGIVTTETGANTAFSSAATADGGNEGVIQIPLPEEVGVIDVCHINGYVIVIPAQGEGINGKFYWIQPGEVVIDALDFAYAERAPDPINAAIVFNDQLWLAGENTTEVWYASGDADAPFNRLQGVVFDRGIHEGTAIQVKDSMVLVDSFGGVFQIKNGEQRLSTPDIEERIRKAIAYQNIRTIGD
jgi:hypothetical protein